MLHIKLTINVRCDNTSHTYLGRGMFIMGLLFQYVMKLPFVHIGLLVYKLPWGHGEGLMVSMLAFDYSDLSSDDVEVDSFFGKILFEQDQH